MKETSCLSYLKIGFIYNEPYDYEEDNSSVYWNHKSIGMIIIFMIKIATWKTAVPYWPSFWGSCTLSSDAFQSVLTYNECHIFLYMQKKPLFHILKNFIFLSTAQDFKVVCLNCNSLLYCLKQFRIIHLLPIWQ